MHLLHVMLERLNKRENLSSPLAVGESLHIYYLPLPKNFTPPTLRMKSVFFFSLTANAISFIHQKEGDERRGIRLDQGGWEERAGGILLEVSSKFY